LTLVALRADRIDRLTDLHGHAVRDLIQRTIIEVVRQETRSSDLLGRHSEDRFLLALPHTDVEGARLLAERIRARASVLRIEFGSRTLQLTLSCGLAAYVREQHLFCDTMIHQAEHALDNAQERGGNQVLEVEGLSRGTDHTKTSAGGSGSGGPEAGDRGDAGLRRPADRDDAQAR
jgi:diguanylate cyclase (GGDEF)-like protein